MAVWIVVVAVAVAALVVGILLFQQRSKQLGVAPPRRPSTARERRLDPGAAERETGLRPPDRFGQESDDYADAATYGGHAREVFVEPEPQYEELAEAPISPYEEAVEEDWQAASVAEVEREAIRAEDAVAYEEPAAAEEYVDPEYPAEVAEPEEFESAHDDEPARFTANRRVRDITPLETDVVPQPTREPDPEPVAEVMAADSSLAGLTKRTPKEAGTPTRSQRVTANQRPSGAARRSPEEVRKTLSKYRGGLQKGREAETDGVDDGM